MEGEEILIKKAQQGNEEAFRIIVETYQRYVFSVCLSVLKDIHEAENASQESFLKLYGSLKYYQFKGFKSYIGRIALNTSIDIKRKSSKVVEVSFSDGINNMESLEHISPQEGLINREERENILRLYGSLPEIYRRIVGMYYIEEMSYQSIAAKEGISLRTVESRLYRAKKMLRESWEVNERSEPL